MNIAVFDIGTNSIHMLVAEIRPDLSFEVLGHEKDTTRLGDGSFESHRLKKSKMQRALGVIDRFYKIAKTNNVQKCLAVATSAVRDAKNGREFLRDIYRRTGIRAEVISGKEEGRLIELAARSSVETRGQKALVVDIGGGSMELVLGDGKKHSYIESFPLGVARLSDIFLHEDPPSAKELKNLEQHIEKTVKKAGRVIRKQRCSMVIGTAGTLINLGSMIYEDETSRPLNFVNHFELERKPLEKIHEKIIQTTLKERLNFPGLDPKRADIIVAGSVLVLTLMRLFRIDEITLSDRGIREGMIIDFIEKNKTRLQKEEAGSDIREKSIRQLLKRWSSDVPHAEQVAKLALKIFQDTAPIHRLGDTERDILKFSCLLHNIGYAVNYKKHHKHTFYLIMNSDFDGFKPEEIEMMAWVSRNHRKSLPKKKELHFVNQKGYKAIKVLGSILRLADGLDRSHFSVVESLDCRVTAGKIVLRVKASKDAELEIWQARQRVGFFEKMVRRRVVLELLNGKKPRKRL
jgi:exopolyphosphatase/guanosine-5'-triphosphate,3'-diphosphate pyrophosphatase